MNNEPESVDDAEWARTAVWVLLRRLLLRIADDYEAAALALRR